MFALMVTVWPASTKIRPLPTLTLLTPIAPSPRKRKLPALTVRVELAGPVMDAPSSKRIALTDLLAVSTAFVLRRTLLVADAWLRSVTYADAGRAKTAMPLAL